MAIKIGLRTQKAVIILMFLAIFAYVITTIVYASDSFGLALDQNSDTLYGALNSVEYAIKSQQIMPISSILLTTETSCPLGKEKLILTIWPGSRGGCDCAGRLITHYEQDECWSHSCTWVFEKYQKNITTWKNVSFCVQRNSDVTYSSSDCPKNYRRCTGITCVKVNESCPVNTIQIGKFAQANLTLPNILVQNFTDEVYFAAYYNPKAPTDETPIIQMIGIDSGLPCVVDHDLPQRVHSTNYPLIKMKQEGCQYYGSDSFSSAIDLQSEADYYTANGLGPEFQDLPGYLDSIKPEQVYLVYRRAVQSSQAQAHCQLFLGWISTQKINVSTLILVLAILDILLLILGIFTLIGILTFSAIDWFNFIWRRYVCPVEIPQSEPVSATSPPPRNEGSDRNEEPPLPWWRRCITCCFPFTKWLLLTCLVLSTVFGIITLVLGSAVREISQSMQTYGTISCFDNTIWNRVFRDLTNPQTYHSLAEAYREPTTLMIFSLVLLVSLAISYFVLDADRRNGAFIKDVISPKERCLETPAEEAPVVVQLPVVGGQSPDSEKEIVARAEDNIIIKERDPMLDDGIVEDKSKNSTSFSSLPRQMSKRLAGKKKDEDDANGTRRMLPQDKPGEGNEA